MIETIKHDNNILAIIIRSSYKKDGIQFLTPDNFSQQLGYMNHPSGHIIPPHIHNPLAREVTMTKEVLVIKSGSLRVDLYSDIEKYVGSKILHSGDVILLADGGHGFEILEECEIIEIKQGPYTGDLDKTRFSPISNDDTQIIE